MAEAPLRESIMGRAQSAGLVEIGIHDPRSYCTDKHRQVDDVPYGGGQGMVMKPEPLFAAVENVKDRFGPGRIVLMTPQGKPFKQTVARRLAAPGGHLIVISGHYEGIDHRVVEALVDEEISIGDYVLTNGTIAAVVLIDAVVRLLPGVLGDERSAEEESFGENGLLEAPHYTRPPDFRGMSVPEILLSGHHALIREWRAEQGLQRTRENRPDLLGESTDPPEPEQ